MEPIIGFSVFFLVVFSVIYLINQKRHKENLSLIEDIKDTAMFSLLNVACSAFNSGAKGGGFNFNRCDLYLIPNALVILGYTNIGPFKHLSPPIILTAEKEVYPTSFVYAKVIKPKKINLNSYHGEVYIEFEVKTWMTTNVEIRLKGISNENKETLKSIADFVGQ